MSNQDLVHYIEKHLDKGFSHKDIESTLLKHGHSKASIQAAFKNVKNTPIPKSHNYAYLIIGIILVVVLSFVGYKAFQYYNYSQEVTEIKQTDSKQIEVAGMTDVEILEFARQNDLSYCEFIDDHNIKYGCKEKVWDTNFCHYLGLTGQNVMGCGLMKEFGDSFKKHCQPFTSYTKCRRDIAINENNVEHCGNHEDCRQSFAIAKSDPAVCKGNAGCITEIAIKNNDKNICDQISPTPNSCHYYFMSEEEILNNFIEEMKSLPKAEKLVYAAVLPIRYGVENCEKIKALQNSNILLDYCYYSYVYDPINNEEKFNPTELREVCSKINDPKIATCCSTSISTKLIKPECDLIAR